MILSSSALRELEPLARTGLAGLLAFLLARVAADMAGLLQRGAQLGIHLLQRAGDTVGDRPGLAGDAATADVRRNIDLLLHVDHEERRVSLLREVFVREIAVE